MTVRTWFRLLRRSTWEGDAPEITIYFRADEPQLFGPWTGPVPLRDLKDYQELIDGHRPVPVQPRNWAVIHGIAD